VGPAACSDGSSDNGDAAHAVGGSVGPANELPGEEVVRLAVLQGISCEEVWRDMFRLSGNEVWHDLNGRSGEEAWRDLKERKQAGFDLYLRQMLASSSAAAGGPSSAAERRAQTERMTQYCRSLDSGCVAATEAELRDEAEAEMRGKRGRSRSLSTGHISKIQEGSVRHEQGFRDESPAG
jgi:hypothetical protein